MFNIKPKLSVNIWNCMDGKTYPVHIIEYRKSFFRKFLEKVHIIQYYKVPDLNLEAAAEMIFSNVSLYVDQFFIILEDDNIKIYKSKITERYPMGMIRSFTLELIQTWTKNPVYIPIPKFKNDSIVSRLFNEN